MTEESVRYAIATIPMDEVLFCEFYEQTARNLRAYLRSMVFDRALVDDLMQESYFRLLKAGLPASMDVIYRKNYLYRIATNLVRDHGRSHRLEPLPEEQGFRASNNSFEKIQDVKRTFVRLKPKERELLWMAYVERFSHEEIAAVVFAKTASIRPMLARARRKFADLLRRRGYGD